MEHDGRMKCSYQEQAQVKFMLKKGSISSATSNKDFWITFMNVSIDYNILQCSVFAFIMLLSKDIDPEG